MHSIRPVGLLAALLVSLSCSDPSSPRTPTSIAVVSGGGQSGVVTQSLSQPVVVEVKDVDGKPVRGVVVRWSVTSGGGSVNEAETATNSSGRAQVQWVLGATAGQHRLSAGVTGVAPTTVTAIGQSDVPASARIAGGNAQSGLPQQPLSDAIVIEVLDQHGNGVPNTTVTFTPTSGVVTPQALSTDGSGIAAAIWTLGAAGTQSVSAAVAGLNGPPLEVTATALSPGDLVELQNDVEVSDIGAVQGENRYYRITLPANVTRLTLSTSGGPGDADLYVRHGKLPTTSASTCRSTAPATTESCTVNQPAAGDWYVLLDAYTTYSGLTLRGTWVSGGSMSVTLTGLPQGTEGSVRVTGPNGYERHLTATQSLPALASGTYTVAAGFVRRDDVVYVSTPENQQVDVVEGTEAIVNVAYAVTAGPLNLDIAGAYVTQSVQRTDGSIALIAGRDGLLRVFARGNAVSAERPTVRARFYHNGNLAHTLTIPAPSSTLPVSHDEGVLASTWNAVVPGSLLQPGTSVLVDVDPDDLVAEADESDNTFPASGTALALDIRASAPLLARLVPVVQQGNGLQGDVTTANRDSYVSDAHALYPLPGIDVDVRAPYTFTGALPSAYDSAWGRLLNEINALRVAEASGRYYYGVVKPAYTSGGTGLGYLNLPAAIGVDWPNWRSVVVAHEWGHNFGRRHVDCGGPASPDPDYPYVGGRLGHHGWDRRSNEIRSIETHYDLMSYCQPTWASDYTYEAVMAFREREAGAGNVAQPSLLVWGRISADGAVLEPAFEVVAAPVMPKGAGRYRLTGTDKAGATVLDISFDAYEVDHLPGERLFAWAIPLSAMGGNAPAEIRLRGRGFEEVRRRPDAAARAAAATADVAAVRDGTDDIRVRWNATHTPVLLVRDGRTGEILSFARGGDARVRTQATEIEINMSDGVKSTMRRIAVPR